MSVLSQKTFQKKDYASSQEVRWCPGCGDYAILSALQKTLAKLQAPLESTVFISGIGCSSRFPYYMSTYGFHTIHGRAPAIATGLAIARPDLDIWVITGDGDGLSIGANHLAHALRRNINIKILLFNNQTYGLTKGQYSPTSKQGTVSKSSPSGSIDRPFHLLSFALGAGASFVARTFDKDIEHMSYTFERAAKHRGAAFVEIYQNCVIFNDKVFDDSVAREHREERLLFLKDGAPLLYGKGHAKALVLDGLAFKSIELDKDTGAFEATQGKTGDVRDSALLGHSEDSNSTAYPYLLSQMELPQAMGVLYANPVSSYEDSLSSEVENASMLNEENLATLLQGGDTWTVT